MPDLAILAQRLATALVLIAHSMGGLIVQKSHIDQKQIAARTRAVILFGTPSGGLVKARTIKFWKRRLTPSRAIARRTGGAVERVGMRQIFFNDAPEIAEFNRTKCRIADIAGDRFAGVPLDHKIHHVPIALWRTYHRDMFARNDRCLVLWEWLK